MAESKEITAKPTVDPTGEESQEEEQGAGGIRIFHLSTAQTSLKADTMLDSQVALYWGVSLGSVPSSSQSKWSASP